MMLVYAVEDSPAIAEPDASGASTIGMPEDPFLSGFFERVPAEIASSFTQAQLAAIKAAFGARG